MTLTLSALPCRQILHVWLVSYRQRGSALSILPLKLLSIPSEQEPSESLLSALALYFRYLFGIFVHKYKKNALLFFAILELVYSPLN